jgi:hypothetical protein
MGILGVEIKKKCFSLERIEFGSLVFQDYYQPGSVLFMIKTLSQILEIQIVLTQP